MVRAQVCWSSLLDAPVPMDAPGEMRSGRARQVRLAGMPYPADTESIMTADTPSGLAPGHNPKSRLTTAEQISELTDVNRKLKRKLFDLYTLFEISRNLSGLLDIDRLLDNLLLTAIGQMGIGAACVVVDRKQDDSYLGLWRAKGLTVSSAQTPHFEKTGKFVSHMARVRLPQDWSELQRTKSIDPKEQECLAQLETSMVCPMLVKEEVRGVLIVSRRLSGVHFSDNDKEFLSILISHFSVAMDNARLYASERSAHARLRDAQAQLVHSEKLAAMGRLSATIAHEVNNPLGIIKNYVHLIDNSADLSGEQAENLGIVSEEVDRIARIVRRLLDFHRPATPGIHDLDLWHVINDCLKLLRESSAHSNVKVALPDVLCRAPVRANAEELKQVFLNLFINALDAMPGGGTLTVRIIVRRHSLIAQVIDSGTGISPANLVRLFEPFFTTKDEAKGTGLGLYVCYGIIQRHEGRITARNLPEGGAVFTVRLPVRKVAE
jgi:signal transduction histidine kinase